MKNNSIIHKTAALCSVIALAAVLFSCAACATKTDSAQTASSAAQTAQAAPAKPAFNPIRADKPTTTIQFPSADGIQITADIYAVYPETAPFIVLCHRAGWSRGEYREIAPKLTEMGFNCMAIDQRSGKEINGVVNETAKAAAAAGKPVQYIDALADIQSAVSYAAATFAKGQLILWGSSYSAALSLVTAAQDKNIIDGVIAFSPGEYFADQGKSPSWISENAALIKIPAFFSSKNSEESGTRPIFDQILVEKKAYYLPSSESKHGSEALYETNEASYWTWKAVGQFLAPFALVR